MGPVNANHVGHGRQQVVQQGLGQDRNEYVLQRRGQPWNDGPGLSTSVPTVTCGGSAWRTCHTNGCTRLTTEWTHAESRLSDVEMNSTRRSHRTAAKMRRMAASSKQLNSSEKSTCAARETAQGRGAARGALAAGHAPPRYTGEDARAPSRRSPSRPAAPSCPAPWPGTGPALAAGRCARARPAPGTARPARRGGTGGGLRACPPPAPAPSQPGAGR